MCGEEDRAACAERLQDFPQHALGACVEACGGFVEEEDAGVACEEGGGD
jgi:hypothetical protein